MIFRWSRSPQICLRKTALRKWSWKALKRKTVETKFGIAISWQVVLLPGHILSWSLFFFSLERPFLAVFLQP
jgi:hypothetical protein